MTQHISRRKALQLLGGGTLAAALPLTVRAANGPLHLGIQTTIWGSVALVAEAAKTFQKAGANVVVDKFDSGAAGRDAMISGHIDCVSIGATPFVIGVAKSNLVGFGMVAYAGGTLALVAGSKSGIKTVAQLKGKRIASQLGSQTDHVFEDIIGPAFGLKKSDYQVVNTPFANMVSALASGSVDAFAGVEPYPSVAVLDGIGTILTRYTKYDMVPVILATNHHILQTRQDDLVKFMKGWDLAVDICRNNPKEAAHLVGNFFRNKGYDMKDEVFALALKHMDVTPTFKPGLKGYLTTLAEQLVKHKRLASMPNMTNSLSNVILDKVKI